MSTAAQHVEVNGRRFRLFLEHARIALEIARMGKEISRDYNQQNPLFVVVLKGSMIFAADLIRSANIPCRIEFLRAASYGSGMQASEELRLEEFNFDCSGSDLILLEDIIDSGGTISTITQRLQASSPNSIRVATLLDKPAARDSRYPAHPDYVGFKVDNEFVVGYGMDYAEWGRHLRDIYVLDE